ncbi:hypothetical protein AB4043_10620, partial [Terriglobus sp. YAF25]
FNIRAIIALIAGIVVALVGIVVPPLRWLYDYAWFVGFIVSGLLYCLLMMGATTAKGSTPLLVEHRLPGAAVLEGEGA